MLELDKKLQDTLRHTCEQKSGLNLRNRYLHGGYDTQHDLTETTNMFFTLTGILVVKQSRIRHVHVNAVHNKGFLMLQDQQL